MDYSEHYKFIERKGNTFIQWKGTDVCIDIHCPNCKAHSHIDDYYMYYFKCAKCGKIYAMSQSVEMIDLPKEHVEFVLKDRPDLIKEERKVSSI
jgi:phage FluMu protein Com